MSEQRGFYHVSGQRDFYHVSGQRDFYHEGMRTLQDRFDGRRVADALAAHRRRYDFWDDDRVLIENAPFFFYRLKWRYL